MVERFSPPALPEVQSYLDGSFEFAIFSGSPGEGIDPGKMIKFTHEPSGRIYIFECIGAEMNGMNSMPNGWLSRFVDDEQQTHRDELMIEKLIISHSDESTVAGHVIFASANGQESGTNRVMFPFTKAEEVNVSEIKNYMDALYLHAKKMYPFESPEAQQTLRDVVAYFLESAQEAQTNDRATEAARARRVAEAITEELFAISDSKELEEEAGEDKLEPELFGD